MSRFEHDVGNDPMPVHWLLYALPPMVGVVIGYLSGGRLRHMATVRLRALWLLWLAAASQLVAIRFVGGVAAVTLSASAFGMAAVCVALNLARHRAVMVAGGCVLAGAGANALAILLNGGMPYSPSAARAARLTVDDETVRNTAAGEGTRLPGLGDVIVVPPLEAVVSIGDLLIAVGVAGLVASLMRPQPGSAAHRVAAAPEVGAVPPQCEKGGGRWPRHAGADLP